MNHPLMRRAWRALLVLSALIALSAPLTAQDDTDTPPDDTDWLTSDDGGLIVPVPQGWLGEPFLRTGIVLTNSADILAGGGPVIPQSGEIFVQITYSPSAPYLDEDDRIDLADVLNLVFSEFPRANQLFSEPEPGELDDMPTLSARARLELGSVVATAYVIAVDRADARAWVLLTALAPADEFDDFLPQIEALVAGVEIDSDLVPFITRARQITSDNGELRIANPLAWYAQPEANTNIALASSAFLLNDQVFERIDADDVIFRLTLQPRFFLFGGVVNTVDDLMNVALLDVIDPTRPPQIVAFEPDDTLNGAGEGRYTIISGDPRFAGAVDVLYLFVDYAQIDRVFVLIGISGQGAMADYAGLALEIANSVEYIEP